MLRVVCLPGKEWVERAAEECVECAEVGRVSGSLCPEHRVQPGSHWHWEASSAVWYPVLSPVEQGKKTPFLFGLL